MVLEKKVQFQSFSSNSAAMFWTQEVWLYFDRHLTFLSVPQSLTPIDFIFITLLPCGVCLVIYFRFLNLLKQSFNTKIYNKPQ